MTRLSWQSLRTRLVAGAVCASVVSIWIVTLVIGSYLRSDMELAISAQQFSTVSLIASEVRRSVNERSAIVESLAQRVGRNGGVDGPSAQALLESHPGLDALFNWGIMVVDVDGLAIASAPARHQRVGTRYGDLPFFPEVKTAQKPVITPPTIGRRTGAPVISIAMPIRTPDGRYIGAVLGIINLGEPNFLDQISNAKFGRTGDFLVTDVKSRICIASSDKRRVMNKPGNPPALPGDSRGLTV